jgi:hypothetical protein
MKTFNSSLISQSQKTKKEEVQVSKVWNSVKVEECIEQLQKGRLHPLGNPFYEKTIGLRNGNITFEYTDEELEELLNCKEDIVYFAEKYCKIKTEEGQYTYFKLRPYQKKALKMMVENRYLVYLASRQIGKTVMSSIFMLWFLCFHTEKNILAVANKEKTVVEIVSKIKAIYKNLPFFIQPGIIKWNEGELAFDNDCRISTSATTEDAGVGFTIDFLYADEFAKVPDNIVRRFWASIYPTLSSLKNSRCLITSTADGFNLFYEIHSNSLKGKNEFANHTTYWYEVPGRDEEWKKREISNLGENGEEIFNREYECKFQESSNILLDSESIEKMKTNQKEFKHIVIDEFEELDIYYKDLIWADDFEMEKTEFPDRYLLTIDLSLGVGLDYSVINIFKINQMSLEEIEKVKNPIDEKDFLILDQVGLWRSNTTDIGTVARITMALVRHLGVEDCVVNFETNQGGDYFLSCLENDDDYYDDLIIHTKHKQDANKEKPGVKLTANNKVNFCNELKNLIRKNRIRIYENNSIDEFTKFGKNKKGSYSNDSGNDDIVMSIVHIVPSIKSFNFDGVAYDVIDNYSKECLDMIYIKLKNSEVSNYIDQSEIYDYTERIDMQMELNRIYNNPFGSYRDKNRIGG